MAGFFPASQTLAASCLATAALGFMPTYFVPVADSSLWYSITSVIGQAKA